MKKAIGIDPFVMLARTETTDIEVMDLPNKGCVFSTNDNMVFIPDCRIQDLDKATLIHTVAVNKDGLTVSAIQISNKGVLMIYGGDCVYIPGAVLRPQVDGTSLIQ